MRALVSAVLLALVLAGCGDGEEEKSPDAAEDALADYFDALADGDAHACDMETDSYREETNTGFALFTEGGTPDCEARVKQMQSMMESFEVDLTEAKYESEQGKGDDEVIVTATYDGSEAETYTMVYEDGAWLVESEGSMEGAASGEEGFGELGSEEGDAASDEQVLALSEGESLTMLGNVDGYESEEATVTVAFDTLTCAESIPKAGMDEDFETTALVADPGNQVCIVELAVTNNGKKPATFASGNVANIRTEDGTEYSETDEMFDDQGFLRSKDRDPSYTTDEVQPGQTKFDVVAYELPTDAVPAELVYANDEW